MTTKVEPTVEKWEVGYSKIMLDWIESQWKIEAAQQAGEPYTRMKFEADAHKVEQKLLTYIRTTIAHSVQEAKAEMVAEIENSKIISSIGYRPSKFRGLSAVAIYNMALDDLLASLKQEEET